MAASQIVLHAKIVHILEKEKNNLILTDFEENYTQAENKMYAKLYKSVASNEFLRKAKYNNYNESQIRKLVEGILYDREKFVDNSKEIAKLLFDEVSISEDAESGSVAVCLFTVDDEKKVGVFKLDFKKNLSSEVKKTSNGKSVDIVEHTNSLTSSLKSNQAVLFGVTGVNDEFNFEILDKEAEKSGAENSFFLDNFLDAQKVEDDSYKTKVLKDATENFITNYYYEDAKQAEDARRFLNHVFSTQNNITPEKLIEDLTDGDEDKVEILKEVFEEKNLMVDDIELDGEWLEKKIKTITKKLDNGFVLKGKLEDFNDTTKYMVTSNEDGSINITLKNIRLIEN
jgi:7,8-dihydro-6-hydroxymethylpterin-pyrophosphokinase